MQLSNLINKDWPQINYDLSGAFVYNKELIALYDFFFDNFGSKLFSYAHDSVLCRWNSGRVIDELSSNENDNYRSIFCEYGKRDIAVELTYNNTLITKDVLSDVIGNHFLCLANEHNDTGRNAVILASQVLEDYVREKYPNLKIISSILNVCQYKGERTADYYNKEALKYDSVMIHPDDNQNYDILTNLDNKEKFEILINEQCIRKCPIRNLHYYYLSKLSLNYLDKNSLEEWNKFQIKNDCQDLKKLICSDNVKTCIFTNKEIKKVYDLGFRCFKLQGRGFASPASFIQDILRIILACDSNDSHYRDYLIEQIINVVLVK